MRSGSKTSVFKTTVLAVFVGLLLSLIVIGVGFALLTDSWEYGFAAIAWALLMTGSAAALLFVGYLLARVVRGKQG